LLKEQPVVMVGSDVVKVEERLLAGGYVCGCGGVLAPWGHARPRRVRGVGLLRPRRARCRSCAVTHVLLATVCLLRRADAAAVIGAALLAKATGSGHRPIARRLDRPASTVRGWLRSFGRNAGAWRLVFTRLLVELDPLTGPVPVQASVFADAVEAIGACAGAARRRLGHPGGPGGLGAVVVGGMSPWPMAAAVSEGRLLSPGTGAVGR